MKTVWLELMGMHVSVYAKANLHHPAIVKTQYRCSLM